MSYTRFTTDERKYLQQLLGEGLSFRKIAAILERSPSSVSREVKRNRSTRKPHKVIYNDYWYNYHRADILYIQRRREHTRSTLNPSTPEWKYIIKGLRKYWSLETICGRWHLKNPDRKPLCASTIYRYIKLGKFPGITAKKHLRRRGKRVQTRNANYNTIHPNRIIPEWPEAIRDRIRVGDWEGDTVYGGIGKGLLISLVDRKSRFLKIGLLRTRSAEGTRMVIEKLLKGLLVKKC